VGFKKYSNQGAKESNVVTPSQCKKDQTMNACRPDSKEQNRIVRLTAVNLAWKGWLMKPPAQHS
jgi:hypothetical protein